jgi:MoxR-like ATPase
MQDDLYSDKFLSVRPLLKSILSDKKEVLLIDELDKSDEEFEAFLLEFLGEMQISISESTTIKAKNVPFVIITSNDMRELSDALKRRCLFVYIDYPMLEREVQIIHSRVDGVDDLLATQIAKFINLLRSENLKKIPSISETIDWVRALVKLEAKNLSPKLVKNTLNILLKTKSDLDVIEPKIDGFLDKLPKKAIKIEKQVVKTTPTKNTDEILNSEDNWNF